MGDFAVFQGIFSVFESHENLGCCAVVSVMSVVVAVDGGGVAGKLAMSL